MPDGPDTTAATRAIFGSKESVLVPAGIAAKVLDRSVQHSGPVEYTCHRDGRVKCGTDLVWKTGGDRVIDYCHEQKELLADG